MIKRSPESDAAMAAKRGTCKKRVFTGERVDMGGHMCSRKSKLDGYCAIHHPKAEQERQNNIEAKWKAKYERQNAIYQRLLEDARKARAYDAVMEWCLEQRQKSLVPEPIASASLTVRRILEETK